MQSLESQSSSSSSSCSQKDELAHFIFQKFVKGNDCARPRQLLNDCIFDSAQRALRMDPTTFNETSSKIQKMLLDQKTHFLLLILNCDVEEPMVDKLLDELSPKLEGVFSGQSETLRPFLDILIERHLYPDPDSTPISHLIGRPMDITAVKRAWGQEYQGTAHIRLLKNIQRPFNTWSRYANSGSITQSSGYGKSRTVDEMAKLIPTIPMNIRAARDETPDSFPPRDAPLVKIFWNVRVSKDPVGYLRFFFMELFGLVRDLARGFERESFATSLYHHFNDQDKRAKFYTDLSEIMEKNTRLDVYQKEAAGSFRELAKLLPESEGPVKMVIYIDDHDWDLQMYYNALDATTELIGVGAFFLFLSTAFRREPPPIEVKYVSSSRFCPAIDGRVAPFTEMSVDCHPSLPEKHIWPGLKLEEIQRFSFAVRFGRPFFWAYYEAMLNDKGEVDAHSETLAVAQRKLVGKPTLSMPKNSGKLAVLDALLSLEYDPRQTHSHELASAMVASHLRTVYVAPPSRRYMYSGYPSEPVLAEAALTFVNSYHTREATGHEPNSNETTLGPLVSFYGTLDADTAGAIDQGQRGETVGKMILLLAYLAAVKKCSKSEPDEQFWGEGCSLVDFLTQLTGDKFCRDVLVSAPDNIQGGLPLNKTFKKSWVRFTHFARAADDAAMTSSMALAAFIRGMAMLVWHSQIGVDVNIPILLDKDKPITESNMSSILVKFEMRSARTTPRKVAVDAEKIKYFPPPGSRRDALAHGTVPKDERNQYYTRPYISVVMELGLAAPSDHGSIPSKVVHLLDDLGTKPLASANQPMPEALVSNVHTPESQPLTSATKHKPDISGSEMPSAKAPPSPTSEPSAGLVHPRYSLFYYGCSHKVYRCIRDTEDATYRALLQTPPVFTDRPSDRPADPLLQMKPFWSAGKKCFSWINEPYLNLEYQASTLEDDKVLVGYPLDVDQDPDAMDESH